MSMRQGDAVMHGRVWLLAGLAVISLALAVSAIFTTVRFDPADHVPAAQRRALSDLRAARWNEGEIALLVRFAEADAVWSPQGLGVLSRLEKALETVPGLDAATVASVITPQLQPSSEVQQAALNEITTLGRPMVVEDGRSIEGPRRLVWSGEDAGFVRDLGGILGMEDRFVSPDGQAALMRVLLASPFAGSYGDLVSRLEQESAAIAEETGAQITLVGFPVRMGRLEEGASRSWPIFALLLVAAGAWFAFSTGSPALALAGTAAVALPALWIVGGAAALGVALDPLSLAVLASLTVGLGVLVANSLSQFVDLLAWGENRAVAAQATLTLTTRSASAALVCALIGLAPFLLLPGTAVFQGLVVATAGLIVGAISVLLALPLMLASLPVGEAWLHRLGQRADGHRRRLMAVADQPARVGPAPILLAVLLLAGVAAFFGLSRPISGPGLLASADSGVPEGASPLLSRFGFFTDTYAVRVEPQSSGCEAGEVQEAAMEIVARPVLTEGFSAAAPREPGGPARDWGGWVAPSPLVHSGGMTFRADQVNAAPCEGIRVVAAGLDGKAFASVPEVSDALTGSLASADQDSEPVRVTADEGSLGAQLVLDRTASAYQLWILVLLPSLAGLGLGLLTLDWRVGLAGGLSAGCGLALTLGLMAMLGVPAGQMSLLALGFAAMASAFLAGPFASHWRRVRGLGASAMDALIRALEKGGLSGTVVLVLTSLVLALAGLVWPVWPGGFFGLIALGLVAHMLAAIVTLPAAILALDQLVPSPDNQA